MIEKIRINSDDYAFWIIAYLAIFLSYAPQAFIVALNADDISQSLHNSHVMLSIGRWLQYFIYERVFNGNPSFGFSTVVGSLLLLAAAYFQYRIIGIENSTSKFLFILLSSISLYYGRLFDYDSTRLVVPLGNALASAGLFLIVKDQSSFFLKVIAFFILSISLALYQSVLMLMVTVIMLQSLRSFLWNDIKYAIRNLFLNMAVIIMGALSYVIMTKIIYGIFSFNAGSRMGLSATAVYDNWWRILEIIKSNYLPINVDYYLPSIYLPTIYVVVFLFIVSTFWFIRKNKENKSIPLFYFAMLASFVGPFCLIFVSQDATYANRSLYSIATLFAALSAIAFEVFASNKSTIRVPLKLGRNLLFFSSLFIVLMNMAAISNLNYDRYAVWEADKVAIGRMLSRVDELLRNEDLEALKDRDGRIPIAAIGRLSWAGGVRRGGWSNLNAEWSRDRVFEMFDKRFKPATKSQVEKAIEGAKSRQPWPHETSVFLVDGTVVIIR